MSDLIHRYRSIPRPVLATIAVVFLVNLSNSAFMLILNIYLKKLGYSDSAIASFVSYRFLGVLLLGFPFGLFIRGRRLRPYIIASAILVPFSSLSILFLIPMKADIFIKLFFGIWGVGVMFIQVTVLPFIMRNTPKYSVSEAISLDFATWSVATIIAGIIISASDAIARALGKNFDEANALMFIILMTFSAILFALRIREKTPVSSGEKSLDIFSAWKDYEWRRIIRAMLPTIIIAIGAGLTIPFMNLFFFSVFKLDFEQFSLMGSLTALLVSVSSLLVPVIRNRFGYAKTIIVTQLLGISFLVLLALTEIFSQIHGIFILAFIAYMFRQPLMNMSSPVSSELTMEYVGQDSQELMSALQSSIWSASWFISAKVFQALRLLQLPYFKIFLITSAFYCLGTLLYHFLIKDYTRQLKQEGENLNGVNT